MNAAFTPPQDLRAEDAVVGACLLSPTAYAAAAEARLESEHFYKPANQEIYAAIISLANSGQPIDAVTVAQKLTTNGMLDHIGGPSALIDAQANTPGIDNVDHYAAIIIDKARLRRLMSTARSIVETAGDPTAGDVEAVIQSAEQAIYEVSNHQRSARTIPAADITHDVLADIDLRVANPGQLRGTPTGFTDYDNLTSGYQTGTLNVVAARPSMGKSSFAAGVANHLAAAGKTVVFFNLEMSSVETLKRFIAIGNHINATHLASGHIDDEQRTTIGTAAQDLAAANLYLNDSADLTVGAMRSESRRIAAATGGVDLIIIDYLQLMATSSVSNAATREREVAEQSRGLKLLAKELSTPVLCLAQVNRGVEHRADKRPTLADLRESGAIEADADTVTFLYRDEVYDPQSSDRGLAEFIVAKHRSGPIGTVKTAFLPQYTSFENLAPQPAKR